MNVIRIPAILLVLALLWPAGCARPAAFPGSRLDYWPTTGWRTSTPERQGMDSGQLAKLFDAVTQEQLNLHSLLVIRNGYIVAEAYFQPHEPETKHQLASVTKSVIGMLTGIALSRGEIKSVRQPVLEFFPGRTIQNLDQNKRSMTLEDLMTMSPGLDCRDQDGTYDRMLQAPDGVQFALDLPMVARPGERFGYCSPAAHLLSAILTQATGKSARTLANAELFAPLGIPEVAEGYWPADAQGFSNGCCGLYLVPRDMAKLGLLYLSDGQWDGKQILPPAWIATSSVRHATWQPGRDYGYLFWVFTQQGYYAAMGMGGQHIYIIPGKNIVAVFTGGEDVAGQDRMTKLLDDYIMPAVRSDLALQENPAALASLAARAARASNPDQPVSALPPTATLVSGRTYILAENSLDWRSLALRFDRGSNIAIVTVDEKLGLMIGLDNRYRVTGVPGAGTIALRGHWDAGPTQASSTFTVEALTLGEFPQQEMRFNFSGPCLTLNILDKVLDTKTGLHGSSASLAR